jgi:hypothetical protein
VRSAGAGASASGTALVTPRRSRALTCASSGGRSSACPGTGTMTTIRLVTTLSPAWAVAGEDVYDRWDAHNKSAQRDCTQMAFLPRTCALPLVSPDLVVTSQGLRANPATDLHRGNSAHWITCPRGDVRTRRRWCSSCGRACNTPSAAWSVLELGSPKPEVQITNLNALEQALAQLQALGGAPGFPS